MRVYVRAGCRAVGITLTITSMITTDPKHPDLDVTEPGTGMQKAYLVLSEEERKKGFVRPYREAYVHVGKKPKYPLRDLTDDELDRFGTEFVKYEAYPESERPKVGRFWTQRELTPCNALTIMGRALSETYARDPKFYGQTYCCACRMHLPVSEFVWDADGKVVGS